jgi:hypothetical protein
MRHQPRGGGKRCARQQAVHELAHAQHAFAQLAQHEHQAHGDAVLFQVGIHAVGRLAAGVQPLAQAGGCILYILRFARCGHKSNAQRLYIGAQVMKRLCLAAWCAHALAQLGSKPGGADLAGAVIDGLQQLALPQRQAGDGAGRGQQRGQPAQRRVVQCGQPLGVKAAAHGQAEQLGRVVGLRCAGQQLVAQPRGKFAHERRARGKAEIGQQGGRIHGAGQRQPPLLQLVLHLGAGLHGVQKQRDAAGGSLWRRTVAAHPVQHKYQPQVALRQRGLRVQRFQQLGQAGTCAGASAQCSTRDGPLPASSTKAGMETSKRSASSATQK